MPSPIVRLPWLWGALLGLGLAFPTAWVVALVFRFPVPFVGYVHGRDAPLALSAVVFYGLLGGFVVVGGLGALVGTVALLRSPRMGWGRFVLLVALLADLPPVLLLSTLDYIIGPW